MLLASLAEDIYPYTFIIGIAVVVLVGLLFPNSGIARDFREGKATAEASGPWSPVVRYTIWAVLIVVALVYFVYKSR